MQQRQTPDTCSRAALSLSLSLCLSVCLPLRMTPLQQTNTPTHVRLDRLLWLWPELLTALLTHTHTCALNIHTYTYALSLHTHKHTSGLSIPAYIPCCIHTLCPKPANIHTHLCPKYTKHAKTVPARVTWQKRLSPEQLSVYMYIYIYIHIYIY